MPSYDESKPSGALFRNDRKINERQPDMTGELRIDTALWNYLAEQHRNGAPMTLRLSAWTQVNKTNGEKYLGIKPSEKTAPPSALLPAAGQRNADPMYQKGASTNPERFDPLDDSDVPF